MIIRCVPLKVKRRYKDNEWRPYFAWLKRITFPMPNAPLDVNGNPTQVVVWVFMEWIETKALGEDGPWLYRLKDPE
jgi:hypothetical protein